MIISDFGLESHFLIFFSIFESLSKFFLLISVLSSHFSEIIIEIHLVLSNFEQIILIVTIIGTAIKAQTTHQIFVQKISEVTITSGLMFNLLHVIFGSTKFETDISITHNQIAKIKNPNQFPPINQN